MDLLTHGFVPYGFATWLKRPRAERWAAAVAGMAPDLDVLWAWLAGSQHELYPFIHRGFTHTLWGAPAMGVFLWAVITRPGLGRRWQRFQGLGPTRDVLPALLLGAWSHLLLDATTITGIPLVWPAHEHRFTTGWFFFSVPYMILVVGGVWIPHLRRPRSDRYVKVGLAACLGVLALAGAIRAVTYPYEAPADARVTPGPFDWRWTVSDRNETGVLVSGVEWQTRLPPAFYLEANATDSAPARRACQEDAAFTSWKWNLWGLPVVDARPHADGGWQLRFRDSARLYEEHQPTLGGRSGPFGREDDRALHCRVDVDGAVYITHQSGFWGS